MDRFSLNAVMEDLIRRMRRKSTRRVTGIAVDYHDYFTRGYRAALDDVILYRRWLVENREELRPGPTEPKKGGEA